MNKTHCLLVVTAGALTLAVTTGCSGSSADQNYQSAAAEPWQCPRTLADSEWPRSEHTGDGTLVPGGSPVVAYQCTYQGRRQEPGTVSSPMITFSGPELAELVSSFNTAGEIGRAGCSAPRPDDVITSYKFNFVYPDGNSAVVDQLDAPCPPLTNGSVAKSVPTVSSSSASPPTS